MTKKEILKKLDKLGIKFKTGELKEKLEARLKRAEKKLAKEEKVIEETPGEKPEEVAVEEILPEEMKPEELKEPEPIRVPRAPKEKIWYYGGSKRKVWKFTDLGNGETRVHFYDCVEVIENDIFKANISEEK